MGVFNRNSTGTRKKATTGFSELNRRTYEASQTKNVNNNYNRVSQSNRYFNNANFQQNSKISGHNNVSNYNRNNQQQRYSAQRKKQSKKSRNKKIIIVVLSVIAALAVIIGVIFGIIGCNMNSGMGNIGLTPTSLDKPFYMVLMGVDSSNERKSNDGGDDNDYRSDSIILARIAADEKKVTLMSIHRDIEVDMKEHGVQKVNSAHSIGGPEQVIKTISELAGVPINHYAEINFDGFKAAVDDLGGVKVNVPMEISDAMAGGYVPAGEQILNGEQALVLCRARHAYDDYGDGDKFRAANQRMVLSAIAQQALSSDILTIAKIATDLSSYIKTDLALNDMIGLAQLMKDINPAKDVYSSMTPTEGVYKDGGWYEQLDKDEWKKMMKRMDQGLPPDEKTYIDPNTGTIMSTAGGGDYSGNVTVLNGSGIVGAAAQCAEKLNSMGFITTTGNADSEDYTKTLIIYRGDNKDAAEAIRDKIGCGKIQEDDGSQQFSGDILVIIGLDF